MDLISAITAIAAAALGSVSTWTHPAPEHALVVYTATVEELAIEQPWYACNSLDGHVDVIVGDQSARVFDGTTAYGCARDIDVPLKSAGVQMLAVGSADVDEPMTIEVALRERGLRLSGGISTRLSIAAPEPLRPRECTRRVVEASGRAVSVRATVKFCATS
ncbi:MAG: hypothetical protein HOV77_19525 [Hamadaea sp.]|uniref:hypothetical protein n=1 Tax=Hamadaea sp. TaxID=2024425 RepID=UPI00179B94D0|nr:hypothetical protein [Hamadaea sp.]NUT21370.1 hypothetical protein [Hamadaea sp.]